MFAIIRTGGKQYKVAANDVIMVEKLNGASGDLIEFTDVLMMGQGDSIKVGAPLVSNAMVHGTVLEQIRDDKIIIFKKKKRHNYRRKNGHRQSLTVVKIKEILADGATRKAKPSVGKVSEQAKPTVKTAEAKVEKTEKTPVKKAAATPKKTTKKVGE